MEPWGRYQTIAWRLEDLGGVRVRNRADAAARFDGDLRRDPSFGQELGRVEVSHRGTVNYNAIQVKTPVPVSLG